MQTVLPIKTIRVYLSPGVLQKIRKAQIVTVERIFIIQAEKKQAVC